MGKHEGVDDIVGSNHWSLKDCRSGAWKKGKVYFAPIWIGWKNGNMVYRLGYSHRYVQSLTQNAVHKYLSKAPLFIDYSDFRQSAYFYFGSNNPYTLWTY